MTSGMPPGRHERRYRHEGRDRFCHVHVPASHDPNRAAPLVLALHGATSNPKLMAQFCGLHRQGEQDGFVVAYPAGTGAVGTVLFWNGGGHWGYAGKNGVDDVGFIRMVVDDLRGAIAIDPDRIHVCGMSNGANMTYRLGAEMADVFASIAGVGGPMIPGAARPQRPLSVLHIHGTDDAFAPFHGGVGEHSLHGVPLPSVRSTIDFWVDANECPVLPQIASSPDAAGDGTTIRTEIYAPGRDGTEVVLHIVEGGGHTWPGRPPLPEKLGKSSGNLDANAAISAFFRKHPKTRPT